MEDTKQKIRLVFEKADNQLEALASIYKLFVPDFNGTAEVIRLPVSHSSKSHPKNV